MNVRYLFLCLYCALPAYAMHPEKNADHGSSEVATCSSNSESVDTEESQSKTRFGGRSKSMSLPEKSVTALATRGRSRSVSSVSRRSSGHIVMSEMEDDRIQEGTMMEIIRSMPVNGPEEIRTSTHASPQPLVSPVIRELRRRQRNSQEFKAAQELMDAGLGFR